MKKKLSVVGICYVHTSVKNPFAWMLIRSTPQNAGYRSWERTQINNSGAEKFVIYFAVILSLMNYTRGDFGTIRNKDLRSTLILDNPFGATSSKHILVPMFAIAKHFRVQMICLSDINKSDVNCFNYVTAKQEPDGSLSVKCSYCHTLMIIRKRNKTSLIKLIREN